MLNDTFDDYIVPELLPPSEDGVFNTLLTSPDAKPVLRDVAESYLENCSSRKIRGGAT